MRSENSFPGLGDASGQTYQELAEALRERRQVIADHGWRERDPDGQLRRLQAVSERIVALGESLPAPVDPHLAHYLERCSYDKALSWLEQRS